jgi:hypothetical protein
LKRKEGEGEGTIRKRAKPCKDLDNLEEERYCEGKQLLAVPPWFSFDWIFRESLLGTNYKHLNLDENE